MGQYAHGFNLNVVCELSVEIISQFKRGVRLIPVVLRYLHNTLLYIYMNLHVCDKPEQGKVLGTSTARRSTPQYRAQSQLDLLAFRKLPPPPPCMEPHQIATRDLAFRNSQKSKIHCAAKFHENSSTSIQQAALPNAPCGTPPKYLSPCNSAVKSIDIACSSTRPPPTPVNVKPYHSR